MSWKVGKVRITKLVEMETVGSTRFILPAATNDEIRKLPWLIPHFATEEGRLKMSIHSLVVETPTRRIVVDTGLGNDKQGRGVPVWNNRSTPFLETMTEAGFPPDSIDTVLCTHLHVDHIGWNTKLENGRWVPTFPKARYIFAKTELDFWLEAAKKGDQPQIVDSVIPIVEAKPKEEEYFFDFEARYEIGKTDYFCPADLPGDAAERAQDLAVQTYELLGCSGFARVDMIMDADEQLHVLEAQAIPGMTETSLLPQAAEAAGISFREMVERLVDLALDRRAAPAA